MLFGVSLIIIALAFGGLIHGIGIADAMIKGIHLSTNAWKYDSFYDAVMLWY